VSDSLGFLALELLHLLSLEVGWLREFEVDDVGGQLGVSVGNGVKTGSHEVGIEGVQEDLLGALAFGGNTDGAAGDARGGDDIIKDSLVNGSQGAGTGSLLAGVVES
jgi:hypothetical protein